MIQRIISNNYTSAVHRGREMKIEGSIRVKDICRKINEICKTFCRRQSRSRYNNVAGNSVNTTVNNTQYTFRFGRFRV